MSPHFLGLLRLGALEPDGEDQARNQAVGRKPAQQREKSVVSTMGNVSLQRITDWRGYLEEPFYRAHRAGRKNSFAARRAGHGLADKKNRREREGHRHAGVYSYAQARRGRHIAEVRVLGDRSGCRNLVHTRMAR